MTRVAFINVQTTDLPADAKIVEVGILSYTDGKFDKKHSCFLPINPEGVESSEAAQALHGYTEEFLAKQKTFAQQADKIASALDGLDYAVYQSSRFVRGHLDEAFKVAGETNGKVYPSMDTYADKDHRLDVSAKMRSWYGKGEKGAYTLEALFERFQCSMPKTRSEPNKATKKSVKLHLVLEAIVANLKDSGQYDELQKGGKKAKISPDNLALFEAMSKIRPNQELAEPAVLPVMLQGAKPKVADQELEHQQVASASM